MEGERNNKHDRTLRLVKNSARYRDCCRDRRCLARRLTTRPAWQVAIHTKFCPIFLFYVCEIVSDCGVVPLFPASVLCNWRGYYPPSDLRHVISEREVVTGQVTH